MRKNQEKGMASDGEKGRGKGKARTYLSAVFQILLFLFLFSSFNTIINFSLFQHSSSQIVYSLVDFNIPSEKLKVENQVAKDTLNDSKQFHLSVTTFTSSNLPRPHIHS